MPQITDVRPSNRTGKRYVAIMDNGDRIHFGLLGGSTYLDHHDMVKREAYILRHYGNQTEKRLIDGMIPSPSLFSIALLWSFYNCEKKSLPENVKVLNRLLR